MSSDADGHHPFAETDPTAAAAYSRARQNARNLDDNSAAATAPPTAPLLDHGQHSHLPPLVGAGRVIPTTGVARAGPLGPAPSPSPWTSKSSAAGSGLGAALPHHHHYAPKPAKSAEDFLLTPDQLSAIVNFDERSSAEQTKLLNAKFGGVDGLVDFLRSSVEHGLPVDEDDPTRTRVLDNDIRLAVYGANLVPPPPSETIFQMVVGNIKEDPIIQILIVSAAITLIVGAVTGDGWYEGLAILIAVIIVLTVTAGNDYSKDKKFKRLLMLQSDKKTKVIRGGQRNQISSWDLVVGDVVELAIGDEVPADGVFLSGNRLVIDESPLTGESLPVKKTPKLPSLFSGCQVSEGSGFMLVTSVGSRSSGGKIQQLLAEAQGQETVLQSKLSVLAMQIGKLGFAAGAITFFGLTIRFIIDKVAQYPAAGTFPASDLINLLRFFEVSITVIVVAVPEGLPLAVTISLAFSMFKMIKDRCFVRHLHASETMGEATAICTDKTGTLTENRMTVVKVAVGHKRLHGEGSGEADAAPFLPDTFPQELRDLLCEAVCINSSCFIKHKDNDSNPLFVGSATEGALLIWAKKLGVHYEDLRKRVLKVEKGEYLFTSERKRMSTLCEPQVASPGAGQPALFRLHVKGASEMVLGLCTQQLASDSSCIIPMGTDERADVSELIRIWAGQGLRTIALAFRDFDRPLTRGEREDPEHDLVFVGLVGIKDPVRAGVPDAVKVCQRAGITVRMVTGDNLLTASKIAQECHILSPGGVALEGPVFRAMSEDDKKAVIPKLQVLARSSPADKHTLVCLLKCMGDVVAVTGDGTNDAPALKEADVGFAMGISGTQIAMNASDIILLDDNFISIVQSIKWGRNVLSAVRKFLQFQLAVNVVAIVLTVVGSLANDSPPLNTVQLLWVNLIMDTFGALGLASDVPDEGILHAKPHLRTDPILNGYMRIHVGIVGVYETVVLLLILFARKDLLTYNAAYYGSTAAQQTAWGNTILFTTFVLMQVVNEVLSRQLKLELNFLHGITRNPLFGLMLAIIIVVQVVMVQFAGVFMGTVALNGNDWGVCIAMSVVMIPFTILMRMAARLVRAVTNKNEDMRISPLADFEDQGAAAAVSAPKYGSDVKKSQHTQESSVMKTRAAADLVI
ncbi:hypothetical protein BC828DRAFT_390266 [Blastocladiella britannica]|nr:hypothetical protein BC828DRAFT_390266 [Blastocladiella britannica]